MRQRTPRRSTRSGSLRLRSRSSTPCPFARWPPATGCTDIAATPALSADSHLLVAHNNDLTAGEEEDVVAIEWRVEDEPMIFTLGIGPWISVGWNDVGLSVTGNEVAPKDEGVGIPRLLQVRDVLTRRRCPTPSRRSSIPPGPRPTTG